jgi:phasin
MTAICSFHKEESMTLHSFEMPKFELPTGELPEAYREWA